MDTTPKYIKMCEMAEEIQEGWEPKEGNCAYSLRGGAYILFTQVILIGDALGRFKFDHTWLPRQDQLQEMINQDCVLHEQIELFGEWCNPYDEYQRDHCRRMQNYVESLASFEQLWLAYVMHEKYGKVWDDKKEEWVHL